MKNANQVLALPDQRTYYNSGSAVPANDSFIAVFFHNIGNADVPGSGTRNIFEYTRLYLREGPKIIENDIFRIIVPFDDSHSYDKDGEKGTERATNKDTISIISSNTSQKVKPIHLSETQKKRFPFLQSDRIKYQKNYRPFWV